MHTAVLNGYTAAAARLIVPYEAIFSADVFAPVLKFLPIEPCRVLDIGAGTGRDAAWFAAQGHDVTAVEPVAPFRDAGRERHRDAAITWVSDSLPHLEAVTERADLIVLNAVWHHVPPEDRIIAMATLKRLAAPQAAVIIAVRTGPTPAERPGFGGDPEGAISEALANGFSVVERIKTRSHQADNVAAGVMWDWLVVR